MKETVRDERIMLTKQMEEETKKTEEETENAEGETKKTEEQERVSSYWYICQPGDTLWEISKAYFGSTDKIQAICDDPYNQIADADLIYAGQWIYISKNLFDE